MTNQLPSYKHLIVKEFDEWFHELYLDELYICRVHQHSLKAVKKGILNYKHTPYELTSRLCYFAMMKSSTVDKDDTLSIDAFYTGFLAEAGENPMEIMGYQVMGYVNKNYISEMIALVRRSPEIISHFNHAFSKNEWK